MRCLGILCAVAALALAKKGPDGPPLHNYPRHTGHGSGMEAPPAKPPKPSDFDITVKTSGNVQLTASSKLDAVIATLNIKEWDKKPLDDASVGSMRYSGELAFAVVYIGESSADHCQIPPADACILAEIPLNDKGEPVAPFNPSSVALECVDGRAVPCDRPLSVVINADPLDLFGGGCSITQVPFHLSCEAAKGVCASNDCKPGQLCVAEPKQCITTPCPQFRCEDSGPDGGEATDDEKCRAFPDIRSLGFGGFVFGPHGSILKYEPVREQPAFELANGDDEHFALATALVFAHFRNEAKRDPSKCVGVGASISADSDAVDPFDMSNFNEADMAAQTKFGEFLENSPACSKTGEFYSIIWGLPCPQRKMLRQFLSHSFGVNMNMRMMEGRSRWKRAALATSRTDDLELCVTALARREAQKLLFPGETRPKRQAPDMQGILKSLQQQAAGGVEAAAHLGDAHAAQIPAHHLELISKRWGQEAQGMPESHRHGAAVDGPEPFHRGKRPHGQGKHGGGKGRHGGKGKGKRPPHHGKGRPQTICDIPKLRDLVKSDGADETCEAELPQFLWKVADGAVWQGFRSAQSGAFVWAKRAVCACDACQPQSPRRPHGNRGRPPMGYPDHHSFPQRPDHSTYPRRPSENPFPGRPNKYPFPGRPDSHPYPKPYPYHPYYPEGPEPRPYPPGYPQGPDGGWEHPRPRSGLQEGLDQLKASRIPDLLVNLYQDNKLFVNVTTGSTFNMSIRLAIAEGQNMDQIVSSLGDALPGVRKSVWASAAKNGNEIILNGTHVEAIGNGIGGLHEVESLLDVVSEAVGARGSAGRLTLTLRLPRETMLGIMIQMQVLMKMGMDHIDQVMGAEGQLGELVKRFMNDMGMNEDKLKKAANEMASIDFDPEMFTIMTEFVQTDRLKINVSTHAGGFGIFAEIHVSDPGAFMSKLATINPYWSSNAMVENGIVNMTFEKAIDTLINIGGGSFAKAVKMIMRESSVVNVVVRLPEDVFKTIDVRDVIDGVGRMIGGGMGGETDGWTGHGTGTGNGGDWSEGSETHGGSDWSENGDEDAEEWNEEDVDWENYDEDWDEDYEDWEEDYEDWDENDESYDEDEDWDEEHEDWSEESGDGSGDLDAWSWEDGDYEDPRSSGSGSYGSGYGHGPPPMIQAVLDAVKKSRLPGYLKDLYKADKLSLTMSTGDDWAGSLRLKLPNVDVAGLLGRLRVSVNSSVWARIPRTAEGTWVVDGSTLMEIVTSMTSLRQAEFVLGNVTAALLSDAASSAAFAVRVPRDFLQSASFGAAFGEDDFYACIKGLLATVGVSEAELVEVRRKLELLSSPIVGDLISEGISADIIQFKVNSGEKFKLALSVASLDPEALKKSLGKAGENAVINAEQKMLVASDLQSILTGIKTVTTEEEMIQLIQNIGMAAMEANGSINISMTLPNDDLHANELLDIVWFKITHIASQMMSDDYSEDDYEETTYYGRHGSSSGMQDMEFPPQPMSSEITFVKMAKSMGIAGTEMRGLLPVLKRLNDTALSTVFRQLHRNGQIDSRVTVGDAFAVELGMDTETAHSTMAELTRAGIPGISALQSRERGTETLVQLDSLLRVAEAAEATGKAKELGNLILVQFPIGTRLAIEVTQLGERLPGGPGSEEALVSRAEVRSVVSSLEAPLTAELGGGAAGATKARALIKAALAWVDEHLDADGSQVKIHALMEKKMGIMKHIMPLTMPGADGAPPLLSMQELMKLARFLNDKTATLFASFH